MGRGPCAGQILLTLTAVISRELGSAAVSPAGAAWGRLAARHRDVATSRAAGSSDTGPNVTPAASPQLPAESRLGSGCLTAAQQTSAVSRGTTGG